MAVLILLLVTDSEESPRGFEECSVLLASFDFRRLRTLRLAESLPGDGYLVPVHCTLPASRRERRSLDLTHGAAFRLHSESLEPFQDL